MAMLIKLLGALGLIFITFGILNKNRLKQNYLFTIGGVCLIIYSTYLKDPVFIPLQIIFTGASLFEIYRIKKTL